MDFVDEFYADKDLSLLKKLTLVIPTYNRNYYLSRCLWYHAHFPFGEIIVADSSPEEKKVVNRETVQKVREMFGANVRYLEYEPETEKYGGDIFRKWGDAVQHVETEYCHFCADKDFVIPTTLIRDIIYMEEHNEYKVSSGFNASLNSIDLDENIGYVSKSYESRISLNDSNLFNRLRSNYNCMQPIIYSTYNTSVLKEISTSISKYKLDIRYGEIAFTILAHICGKFQYFPENLEYMGDNSIMNKTRAKKESSNSRYPSLQEYSKHKECDAFYNNFKSSVIEMITNVLELDPITVGILIEKELNNQIVKNIEQTNFTKLMCKFGQNKIIFGLWYRIPYSIKKFCSTITFKIFGHELILSENRGNKVSIRSSSPDAIIINFIVKTNHLYIADSPLQIELMNKI